MWQRLKGATIDLPPLRHRKSEIPQLVDHLCKSFGKKQFSVIPAAQELLCRYDWAHGNVRELRNCLRSMIEESENGVLTPSHIPDDIFTALLESKNNSKTFSLTLNYDLKNSCLEDLENKVLLDMVHNLLRAYPDANLLTLESVTGLEVSKLSGRIRKLLARGELSQDVLPERFWRNTQTTPKESSIFNSNVVAT